MELKTEKSRLWYTSSLTTVASTLWLTSPISRNRNCQNMRPKPSTLSSKNYRCPSSRTLPPRPPQSPSNPSISTCPTLSLLWTRQTNEPNIKPNCNSYSLTKTSLTISLTLSLSLHASISSTLRPTPKTNPSPFSIRSSKLTIALLKTCLLTKSSLKSMILSLELELPLLSSFYNLSKSILMPQKLNSSTSSSAKPTHGSSSIHHQKAQKPSSKPSN